ncbi:MAG: ATP-binding cassette domain-containing protein [Candidatus Puniceispirillales bacterium]|tara:strand:+ start:2619 stop:3371 length:753 start_codon:yes stop_codon:yes gene_type:complete
MRLGNLKKIFSDLKLQSDKSFLPLEIKNLNYSIGSKEILYNLNIKIISDRITVIMGPNGAGKSIFLKILNGIIRPTSGKILWNEKVDESLVLNGQALVFQKPVLLRRSVKANLDFFDKLTNLNNYDKNQLLKIVDLLDQKNQPARLLSLGEQQRLSLIRALLLRPRLIMLDEPTANLDPASTKIIEDIIISLKEFGIKIIFVTHNILQAKRLADEVIFFDKGKLIEHSNSKEFFLNSKSMKVNNYLNGIL